MTEGSWHCRCYMQSRSLYSTDYRGRRPFSSVEMADRGFGLTPEDIRRLAYIIVSRSGRPHPLAGLAWMEEFRKRHHQITLRSPHSLSYCRTMMANKSTVEGFLC